MPIFFKCPGCGVIYRLNDGHSGKPATCRCGCRFRVPTPASSSPRPVAVAMAEEFVGEEVGTGAPSPLETGGNDTREYFPPEETGGGDATEDEDSGEGEGMGFFSAEEEDSPAGQSRIRADEDDDDEAGDDRDGDDDAEDEVVAAGGRRSLLSRFLLLLGAACLVEVLFLPVWTMPEGWPAAVRQDVEVSASGESAQGTASDVSADSSGTEAAKADDGWGAEWTAEAAPAAAQPEKTDADGAVKAADKPAEAAAGEAAAESSSESNYEYEYSEESTTTDTAAGAVMAGSSAALSGLEMIQRGAEGDPVFFALAGGAGLAALLALLGLVGVRIGAVVGLLLTVLVVGAEAAGFLTIIKAAEGLAAVQDALAVLPTLDPQIFMTNYGAAALAGGTLLVLLGGLGCSFGVFRSPAAATGGGGDFARGSAARVRGTRSRVVKPGSPKRGRELTPAFISPDGPDDAAEDAQAGEDDGAGDEDSDAAEDADNVSSSSGAGSAGGLKKVGKKKVAKKKTAKKKKVMLKKK